MLENVSRRQDEMTTKCDDDDGNDSDAAPLPLIDLRRVLSRETYAWLQRQEEEERTAKNDSKDDEEEEARQAIANLFENKHTIATEESSCCASSRTGNDNQSHGADDRVQEWTSSTTNIDGIGGYDDNDQNESNDHEKVVTHSTFRRQTQEHDTSSNIAVQYILSSASGGHGDSLWSSSRFLANALANPERCRHILGKNIIDAQELLAAASTTATTTTPASEKRSAEEHPLVGLNVLELGAGAGLPSWIAMYCGASTVVCTDQAIPQRIRCMAESAERNRKRREVALASKKKDDTTEIMGNVMVTPYNWGSPVKDIVALLTGNDDNDEDDNDDGTSFDVILAADCIYNPNYHNVLLDSIKMFMTPSTSAGKRGHLPVALLSFALHGNTADENVWGIVNLAREMGFQVEVLEPKQLKPQIRTMDAKRGLVHTLRLTWIHRPHGPMNNEGM